MHIHILGICGTFMGGVAMLAREKGFTVTGSDTNVYPPMSTQLESQGIGLIEGYDPSQLSPRPDLVVIGNAMSRGNPVVEAILNDNIPYTSGPQFVAEHLLRDKWVLGVAGTHGKTTTTSMLSWILDYAGLKPGFLVGGVPENFGVSARGGDSSFFVIEADEYDTAFFDKRSKFVHYRPRTLIMNNLEFDHADIFPDLDAIKKQFHHLVRTVPGNGLIIVPSNDANLASVIKKGCWTNVESFSVGDNGSRWSLRLLRDDASQCEISLEEKRLGTLHWDLIGTHNAYNALAAIIAARHVGVPTSTSIDALANFKNVKRRMELRGCVNNISVYDDFAHHPTAIKLTLGGLKRHVGDKRVFAVLEPRSNTMRMGVHQNALASSVDEAEQVIVYEPKGLDWNMASAFKTVANKTRVLNTTEDIVTTLVDEAKPGDHILVMSNGGFENIHQRILTALSKKYDKQ